MQGRRVYVNRVSSANTLRNEKSKNLLAYFRGSVVLHTLEHSRTDQIKCIVSHLQPARGLHVARRCVLPAHIFLILLSLCVI
jgi:hypothetical protein